jgi:2-polyprenyl-3-methyl-5-hydroxy-6-metoxy-1,4-benzoquinol methylase
MAVAHGALRARKAGIDVAFFRHDVIRESLPAGYDLVTCSLFLHHLTEEEAVTVLERMKEAARIAVVVSDLRRSRAGYLLAWAGTRILTRSSIVHFDGPVSVRAAFTLDEALMLANRAGLAGARVESCWPYRYLLTWRRP